MEIRAFVIQIFIIINTHAQKKLFIIIQTQRRVHTSLVIFLFIGGDQDSSTDKEKKCNKRADAANGHITASSENGTRLQRK